MLKDRWGSRKLRLSVENMRGFHACCLCLQSAQRPVCCSEGHLFCKVRPLYLLTQECVLNDLVTQKTQLAEHAKRRAELVQKKSDQDAEDAASKERSKIAAFEASASALPSESSKRKREDEGDGSAKQARTDESPANPAFWLPSLTPGVEMDAEALRELAKDDRPSTTMCIAGSDKPHKLTMKGLVPVHFSTRTVDTKPQLYCPSCKKEFALASQVHVLRKCGHVLCASCTKELVETPLAKGEASACPECSTPVPRKQDVIAIAREGTGFAGGGRAEAKTKGIAFQG